VKQATHYYSLGDSYEEDNRKSADVMPPEDLDAFLEAADSIPKVAL